MPGIRAFGGRAERDRGQPTADERWRVERAEAFALFDDARLLRAYRLASLVLRDRDEAEDATQEAIARAWSNWGSLRDRSRFDAWFDRILVNVCRNRLRHVSTIRMLPLEAAGAPDSGGSGAPAFGNAAYAADGHSAVLDRLALEPAFARLNPEQRIVVVLRFWLDLTVDEIAERLGMPSGTVKSRLHYALRDLREALDREEGDPGGRAGAGRAGRRGTSNDGQDSRRGPNEEVRRG